MSYQEEINMNDELIVGFGIPDYKKITEEKISQQIPKLLIKLNNDLTKIEEDFNSLIEEQLELSWANVIEPIHRIEERLRWSWGVVSHLNAVCNTTKLREVYSKLQPDVIRFSNRLGQSEIIYKVINKLAEGCSNELNQTQKRILDNQLLLMKHRGIGLEQSIQQEFNSITERLADLSTSFSNNVLDATQKWSLLLTKKDEVEGLPKRVLQTLAQSAKEQSDLSTNGNSPTAEKGPWRLGLDMPSYIPFMTYAKNRSLRESLYKAHVKRASDGKQDNQPLIEEILILRKKQANLLGYKTWADLSLSSKMAKNIGSVERLLEELRKAALPTAKKELSDLKAFAKESLGTEHDDISPWDLSFLSEQLRQDKFDLNQEALRPWFPLPNVLEGLFNLCNRLFGISIVAVDEDIPKWHDDVRFFKVFNEVGDEIAAFYLDPYSRPSSKRGGAWMDECLIKSISPQGRQILPIAYLICNQTPPFGDEPSLMSFEEVQTLFHEFGHGLQHMLTTIDYPQAAGINNVEWDAVELPSQFMENWCLDEKTLLGLARHWKTNEPLPYEKFQKLRESRNFNSGLATLRQLHFAITDLRLHSDWEQSLGISPDELRREIASTTTVIPPIEEDRFLCAFGHIFSGGYSAGYYSYKWAEVLSADAFAAFEEIGLEKEELINQKGRVFRNTILGLGGSKDPEEIFQLFRGRSPTTNALIKHSGLKQANR